MLESKQSDIKNNPALVHDWIFGLRGGERCLQAFLCMYQQADVFALFHRPGSSSAEIDRRFRSASLLNNIPGIEKLYRLLLPLFPFFSSLPELAGYKTRISLSHAASKNIRAGSGSQAFHVCYCFTPMRYIWDQAGRYLGWKSVLAWPIISFLRSWDRSGSARVNEFVAISSFVAARIRKYYGRRAKVVFPPVATAWLAPERCRRPDCIAESESAYLYAGALVPYKGADLAIKACNNMGRPIWIAGDGPELPYLKSIAGPNVKFTGKLDDNQLAYLLRNCRALIFPCKEDFGILPLEANAAGRPVIALYAGACKETIKGFKSWESRSSKQTLAGQSYSGVFIKPVGCQPLAERVEQAIKIFEENEGLFDAADCVAQAAKYSPEVFYDSWRVFAGQCPGLREAEISSKQDFVRNFECLRG